MPHPDPIASSHPPRVKPARPHFSSGPCAKPPGWSPDWLAGALTGRSHRSDEGVQRISGLIAALRALLELPHGYRLAIVPGSDTGAFEMALWSLLGARPVDVLAWEVFGKIWVRDITQELKLTDVRVLEAPYGRLPDLRAVDSAHDVVFTANGTTSGVRIPHWDWISNTRTGLTFCDATSAVLSQPIDWTKIDVATFSWQKALGGEAAHGVLILSPRAVARAKSHTPAWPVPKLFRFARDGRIDEALFSGQTINTPSMLCIEDCAQAVAWAERAGGLAGLLTRAEANAAAVYDWIARTSWAAPLAEDPATRSLSSICITFADGRVARLDADARRAFMARLAGLLSGERVAFDIAGHRAAPPCLRLWTGPTVETSDLEKLFPWLDWAFTETAAGL